MGNFTFRRVISFFVLSLLCIGSAKADDEGYYIVGPQASKGADFFNEYLKMKQDPNNPNVYSIAIPARYPIKNLFREKNGDKESQYKELFKDAGLKFLVAKKTVLEHVIDYGLDDKVEFLAPMMADCSTEDNNLWVGTTGSAKGTVTKWSQKYSTDIDKFQPSTQMWEIRKPMDDIVGKLQEKKVEVSYINQWNGTYYCWEPNSSYVALDGSYIFKIDVSDKNNITWTMDYQEVRVGYLVKVVGWNNEQRRATNTYTIEQTRNKDSKYTNIFMSPSVVYEKDCLYLYMSNYKNCGYCHEGVVATYNNLNKNERSLDEAMLHFTEITPIPNNPNMGDPEGYSNVLSQYGPSTSELLSDPLLEGNRHVLTNMTNNKLNIPYTGSYPIKWYPYLGGTKRVDENHLFSDGNSAGIVTYGKYEEIGKDIPDFNALYIHPGKENPALKDSFQLTYDKTYDAYVVKLTPEQFGRGSFYFEDTYTHETLERLKNKDLSIEQYNNLVKNRIWSEDDIVNNNPSDANPNRNSIDANVKDHKDNQYLGPTVTGHKVYLIKYNVLSEGVSCYSISSATGTDIVNIPSLAGQLIRTYNNSDKDLKVPTGCKAYVVNGCGANDGKLVVKLHEINYIPKNTGIVLYAGEGTVSMNVEMEALESGDSYTTYTGVNYLVPTNRGSLGPCEYTNGDISARNYFLGVWSNCSNYDKTADYVGFFRVASGSTTQSNKAYLRVPTDNAGDIKVSYTLDELVTREADTKGIQFVFDDDDSETTGISEINTTGKEQIYDDAYYTLTGAKVVNPTSGIYIHQGKTVVIK